ncbi:MAG: hypothetical protein E7649_04440 [Ruminococcaceae bacterium]|nr:hypothetical protein [Oscillospiraceae bacterium]
MKADVKITDFHSHILPFMDDGSRSVEESLQMLRMLKSQGVDRVVATPHFYPKQEDPVSFLKRRSESVTMLRSYLSFQEIDKREIPEILIGAEVAYFGGMSLYKNIRDLCIQGTDVMLLEMPFCRWTDVVVNEVCKMRSELGIKVVLAHIDRYFHYVDNEKFFKLKTHRVLMQANADPFLRFISGRRILRLIHSNSIHALGSDCHNITERPSNMNEAINVICSKGYSAKLVNMMGAIDELLSDATPMM